MGFRKTILLVDDEQDILTTLSLSLEVKGFEVLTASDGLQALELAKSAEIDLILLDVMIPRMNGFKICFELKSDEKTKDIPVLLLTALGDSVFRHKANECGADGLVAKPFETVQLVAKIKQLLSNQAQLNQERKS